MLLLPFVLHQCQDAALKTGGGGDVGWDPELEGAGEISQTDMPMMDMELGIPWGAEDAQPAQLLLSPLTPQG